MGVQNSRSIIVWFFLIYFLISFFLFGWLLWPFSSIFLLAAVVTGIFNPVYTFLTNKIKASRASLLTCILIFIILFVPIVFFVGILSKEAYELYLMAKDAVLSDQIKSILEGTMILERANSILHNFNMEITGEQLNQAITQIGKIVGLFLYQQATLITSNVLMFFVNFFFMLLIVYYLLIDKERLITFIVELSPLPDEQDRKLIKKFKDMTGAILIGNGLGGLIQGFLGGLIFALFGLKSPFLWGFVMALLAFLPIVGIGAVFFPAAAYLFLNDRIAAGIFFLVFYILLSSGIEYLFKPRLVGHRVQMHTLLVFLSIIGGLKVFGILGIIFGPIVATAFLTLTDMYHSSYKNMVK